MTTHTTTNQLTKFRINDLGVDYPDYFSGDSAVHSRDDDGKPYAACVIGIGDSPLEAIEDALEMIAQVNDGLDFSAIEADPLYLAAKASDYCVSGDPGYDPDSDPYYYVSIYYSLTEETI